jgi:hypothetical protein
MQSYNLWPEWLDSFFRRRPAIMKAVTLLLCVIGALIILAAQGKVILYQGF